MSPPAVVLSCSRFCSDVNCPPRFHPGQSTATRCRVPKQCNELIPVIRLSDLILQ
jgi:hypothetical protein